MITANVPLPDDYTLEDLLNGGLRNLLIQMIDEYSDDDGRVSAEIDISLHNSKTDQSIPVKITVSVGSEQQPN